MKIVTFNKRFFLITGLNDLADCQGFKSTFWNLEHHITYQNQWYSDTDVILITVIFTCNWGTIDFTFQWVV